MRLSCSVLAAGEVLINKRINMEIRKALLEDCPRIARVQVDSYRTAYADLLPWEYLDHFCYEEQEQDWRALLSVEAIQLTRVAVLDSGEIVGYALVDLNPSDGMPGEGELVALHVRNRLQRKGIGIKLFAAVAGELAKQGCRVLFLWMLADNPARSFYERFGGVQVDERPWQNNAYFKTQVCEVKYAWSDISTIAGAADQVIIDLP